MSKIYITIILLLLAMLSLPAFAKNIPHGLLFWAVEGLGALTLILLIFFYHRVMRPMHVISNGMGLLHEQDFSSRLRNVGEPEADRIVEIFNRMMTELKEGRLRLRERNHLLDLLVEVSPMGVIMLDFDGRISSLNPAARQFLGITSHCSGKSLGDIPGDLAQRISRIADDSTETFTMSDAHIYRCTRRSFLDCGFQHPFILIESLTRDVVKAEREAYGKVIRMISHETNNTMAAISSIMETVNDELREMPGTDDLRTALQACADRSRDMSAFITRFADVVKIPAPVLQPTPLNSLITANRQFIESLCSAHGIRLTTSLCPDPSPMISIDVSLMTQVLVNIIKNSIESIADGSANDGEIIIATSLSPLLLTVTDNGAGISPDTEKNLFTPFFSTKPNGHGIGLLLIREILTRHNCRLSLKTGTDGRTVFRIEFQSLHP